jgi:membrane associated rhomboid family serine protease
MKALYKDLPYSFLLVVVISISKVMEYLFQIDLVQHGLYPRDLNHLYGILTIPFLHSGWEHLFNNATALFVLTWMLFHFYRPVAWKSLLLIYLLSGLWLWIGGRASYHIGASAVIYGLAGFLFVGGIVRKHLPLMGVSLLILFLYGSMIWGIFPIKEQMSWEGHLFGLLAGVSIAYLYRNEGPQRKQYTWELEDEEDGEYVEFTEVLPEEPVDSPSNQSAYPPKRITYIYTQRKDSSNDQ